MTHPAADDTADEMEPVEAEADAEANGDKKIKIIKRYQNRKLYDTERSCYVTLNEIAELIKSGEDVKVIDNRSKRDLTSLTLAQIIFEEEKKRKKLLPLGLLKNIIQTPGGTFMDLWKKSVGSVSSLSQAQEEVEAFFQKLVAKGSISKEEGQHILQNVVAVSHRGIEELQRRVDEGVKEALARFVPGRNLREEFAALEEKIDQLEKKLRDMEKGPEKGS